MYAKQGLFPAYTTLEDVRIAYPSPARARTIARGLDDLWATYNNGPHINVVADPGSKVPLPDNGFDPNSLSELGSQNTMFNRGAAQDSEQELQEIKNIFQSAFDLAFEDNASFMELTPNAIKQELYKTSVGGLLIYNGHDKTKLRIADALCVMVDSGASEWTAKQPMDQSKAKSQILGYLKPSECMRQIVAFDRNKISQMVTSQTAKVDHIDDTLLLLDLQLPYAATTIDSFRDFALGINIAQCNLKEAVLCCMLSGAVNLSIMNVFQYVLDGAQGDTYKNLLSTAFNEFYEMLRKERITNAQVLEKLLSTMAKDLDNAHIDSSKVGRLAQRQQELSNIIRGAAKPSPRFNINRLDTRQGVRSEYIQELTKEIVVAKGVLLQEIAQCQDPEIRTALCCELRTFEVCERFIRAHLQNKVDGGFAKDLYLALDREISQSNIPNIVKLRNTLVQQLSARKAAEEAALSKSMLSAVENNTISQAALDALAVI